MIRCETQVGMEQHLEEAEVEITTWPMSLESQFSSMRLREVDITGSVLKILKILTTNILMLTGQDSLEG